MSKIIIANWKMNPSSKEEAMRLVKKLISQFSPSGEELVIAPPFVYLESVKNLLPKEIKLGAQDLSWAERGAYTGEVSGLMLKNLGCDYVIIGHSERRYKIGESDEMINLKLKAAIKIGLNPILAVGERNQNEDIMKVLSGQIKNDLEGLEAGDASKIIFAYEPVWAIGTGTSDTPDHALSLALLVRKIFSNLYAPDWAQDLKVLYGGSVTSGNARNFVAQPGIDGALIGGDSLDIEDFLKIVKAAEND